MGRLKSECPSGNFIVRTKPNAKGEVASRFILIFKHTLVAMEEYLFLRRKNDGQCPPGRGSSAMTRICSAVDE